MPSPQEIENQRRIAELEKKKRDWELSQQKNRAAMEAMYQDSQVSQFEIPKMRDIPTGIGTRKARAEAIGYNQGLAEIMPIMLEDELTRRAMREKMQMTATEPEIERLPTTAAKDLAMLQSAQAQAEHAIDSLESKKNVGGAGLLTNARLALQRAAPYLPEVLPGNIEDLAEMDSQLRSLKRFFVLAQDKGIPSDFDVQDFERIAPQPGEPHEIRIKKLARLRNSMRVTQKNMYDVYAGQGYYMGGVENPELDAMREGGGKQRIRVPY